jgi:hypothetical protein
MAVAQGYGKTVTSGSVFAYDTGDTRNSYRGRPTVNYIAHHNAMPQTSYNTYTYTTSGTWPAKHPLAIRAYNAQGSEISAYVNTGVGDWTNTYHAHWQYDPILKKPVTVMQASDSNWKAKSFGTGMAAWTSLGMSAGQQYVISWDQYTTDINLCADAGFYSKNTSNSTNFHDGRSYGSAKNTLLNTWQRVYYTFTVNATRNLNDSYGSIYMYGHTTSNSGGTLKIANVQLELGVSVPSPYVDHTSAGLSSTRSATQGLLPLVGNSTIDLSNVSFDSNAQMTFDGTDDYTVIGTVGITDYSQPFTMECIFKVDSAATWDNGFLSNIYGIAGSYAGMYGLFKNSNNAVGLQLRDATTTSYATATGLSKGSYYHLVGTWNGSNTMVLYVNGVVTQTTSTTKTGATDSSNLYIGGVRAYGGAAGNYYQGEIPIVKYYNRALTAAEINQNYLHYKTRFNLS